MPILSCGGLFLHTVLFISRFQHGLNQNIHTLAISNNYPQNVHKPTSSKKLATHRSHACIFKYPSTQPRYLKKIICQELFSKPTRSCRLNLPSSAGNPGRYGTLSEVKQVCLHRMKCGAFCAFLRALVILHLSHLDGHHQVLLWKSRPPLQLQGELGALHE